MIDTVLIAGASRPPSGDLVSALRGCVHEGTQVRVYDCAQALEDALDEHSGGVVVVLDLEADRAREEALTWIPKLRTGRLDLVIVISTDRADVDLAADVVGAGASDLVARGERLDERVQTLLGKLEPLCRALGRGRQLSAALALDSGGMIRGESDVLRRLLERVVQVAPVPRPVLVIGERGTGKELIARALHEQAGPPGRPFVAVNCAALGDGLLESELFGHERGAFTGADFGRAGRFELADNGTLFLDEIGHATRAFQQDLLRVVEYGTYVRVGGTRERTSSARIVAASNVDLAERVERGDFLPDLYDRLAFEVLRVPPLRERGGDVLSLAAAFLADFGREYPPAAGATFESEAELALRHHSFPGNVRELKTVVERAAYRAAGRPIAADDLGLEGPVGGGGEGFHAQVASYQTALLRDALSESGGNQREAAERLELSYDQFRYHRRRLLDTK